MASDREVWYMVARSDRRRFLEALGSIGAAGLAGCLTGTDSGDGDDGGNGSDGSDGSDGGDGGDGDGNGGRTLKAGVLQPVTGPLAPVGGPVNDAGTLPAKQVNNADVDFEVDIQSEDTQTDPQAAISAAQALVDGGYPAISGTLSSAATLQVAQNVCIPNEIVQVTLGTAPSITTLEDNDLVYRTTASTSFMADAVAQVTTDNVGASSVSVLYVNDSYGQGVAEAFEEQFDGDVPASVPFESGQSSYTSQLTDALSSNPDALFIVAFTENGVQILKDFYADFSADTDILSSNGLYNPAISESVGHDISNITGVTSVAAGPSLDAFQSAYQNEYDTEPGQYTAHSYDATAVLLLANAAAGENDGASIRSAMREVANPDGQEVGAQNLAEGIEMAANGDAVNYQGAANEITFDDNGDVETAAFSIYRFTEDGSLELGETLTVGT
jgi:ABC-type branched-subunit amino acid transport system substrate-binding protein